MTTDHPFDPEAADRYADAALDAGDEESRDAAINEGLLAAGPALLVELLDVDEDVGHRAAELLFAWLEGRRISERADEADLRLAAAELAREDFASVSAFDRLHAQSIIALPAGHDRRDLAAARALLEGHLAQAGGEDDPGEEVRTIAALFDCGPASEDEAEGLIDRALELRDEVDDYGWKKLEISAGGYCNSRFVVARDGGDAERAEYWLERGAEITGLGDLDTAPDDPADLIEHGAELHKRGRFREAAEAYMKAVAAYGFEDDSVHWFAVEAGAIWLRLDEPQRAIDALEPLVPHAEAYYLTAVLDEDVATGERTLGSAVDLLALAQAARGRWAEAMHTLDRGRSLRLRYRAALREHPEAAEIVGLERQIQQLARGVAPAEDEDADPDRLRGELLERYRTMRPSLPEDRLESPTVEAVIASLEPDEAVLVIAYGASASIAALIAAADSDPPDYRSLLGDFGEDDWILALGGGGGPGWVDALVGEADEADSETGLAYLLDEVDKHIGRPLGPHLAERGIRRLIVIVDDLLHLIPWWALASFSELDVAMATSLSELVRTRRADVAAAPRAALVVANPTLDLRLSGAAAGALAARLEGAGFRSTSLVGERATETEITEEIERAALLHFAGHGRADRTHTSLEVHPGAEFAAAGDPFPDWEAQVGEWRAVAADDEDEAEDDAAVERSGDVPGRGRLHLREWPDGRVDRWLEHRDGTITATYAGDTIVRLAELFSADDIIVSAAARECRLAVLSACASAFGAGRSEAQPSLPAALQVAGVESVVGTLWPVEEALALFWTDLFYESIGRDASVDVASVVRQTNGRMRAMSREESIARSSALIDRLEDPVARFVLEAYADELPDPPFASPLRWAAFYATGSPTVAFQEVQDGS